MADDVITPLAEALLECFADEIAKMDDDVRPAAVCLRPGAQIELLLSTQDDECCEGLAWVRVASIFPSASFPDPDSAVTKCGTMRWAAVLEMGVARCAPTPDASHIPTCTEWTDVTRAVLADAAAMRCALHCFSPGPGPASRLILPGTWQPMTTEGGCVGGTMLVTVAASVLDCCDDESA